MRSSQIYLWRFCLAWIVGVAVAGAALSTLPSGSRHIQQIQRRTQKEIRWIERGVALYKKKTDALPQTLGQLRGIPDADITVESNNTVLDPWKRPFLYSIRNGKPHILSLGEDGIPGGVGLDCDISDVGPKLPPKAELTLLQLAQHPASRSVLFSALCCGVVSFGIAWAGLREDKIAANSLLEIIAPLLITTFFAALVATVLTAFHVPSGH